jgi:hypothetical protein
MSTVLADGSDVAPKAAFTWQSAFMPR